MIPKIIHYCWFGGGKLPADYASYIKEWTKINKGYKVMCWDESNSPLELDYIKVAVKNKKWSNISNFMRLYALYNHGGVYLDTDMKMIKPLDELLENDCFFGFEEGEEGKDSFSVNSAISGSVKKNPFIKVCLDSLQKKFDGKEESDLSGPRLLTSVLKEKYGLKKYGEQTLKKNIKLYPKEYFYPVHVHKAYLLKEYKKHIFPETVCVHMWGRTWVTSDVLIDTIDYLNLTLINKNIELNTLKDEVSESRKVSDEIWEAKLYLEKTLKTKEDKLNTIESYSELSNLESFVKISEELAENKRIIEEVAKDQSLLSEVKNNIQQVEKLNENIEFLQSELKQNNIALASFTKQEVKFEKEKKVLQDNCEIEKKTHETLAKRLFLEIDETSEQVKKLEAKIETLENELNKNISELKFKSEKLLTVENVVSQQKQREEVLELELEKNKNFDSANKLKLKEQSGEILSFEKEIEKQRSLIDKLENELEIRKADTLAKEETTKVQMTQIILLEKKIVEKEHLTRDLEKGIVALKQTVSSKEEEIKRKEVLISSLKNQLENNNRLIASQELALKKQKDEINDYEIAFKKMPNWIRKLVNTFKS